MQRSITLWSRDGTRRRVGILPILSLQAVFRESGLTTWVADLDGSDRGSQLAKPGTGVIAHDAQGLLFSGPILSIQTSSQGDTRTVTISGESDMRILNNRLVHPDPTRGWDQQTTVSHYSARGVAEDLIVNMVNVQAGVSCPFTFRRTPGLPLQVSRHRGTETTVQARWSVLLEEVQALARDGGLVVDVRQRAESTDLELVVRTPVDRSRTIRFSQRTGLGDFHTELSAPTATVVYVGGKGEGTARNIYAEARPGQNQWNHSERVEVWKERSDTDDRAEFQKTVRETFKDTDQSGTVDFTVTETDTNRFREHYQLGDTVSVQVPGGALIVDRVRSVEVKWDEHGRTVKPTVGSYSTSAQVDRDTAEVRRIQDSVRRLEVR